ncbi:MAG: hypothetical protein KDE00_12980 [Rhodobacteraceae bacterium]|nr:hypothetical protein [Paracoccaceae bacterium]
MKHLTRIAALFLVLSTAACGPLLVGAGGAVIADKVAEDQTGTDGLF